jgi:hypothetical protein
MGVSVARLRSNFQVTFWLASRAHNTLTLKQTNGMTRVGAH